mgnify:CR=1 FL=1|jgi:hypothetical protein
MMGYSMRFLKKVSFIIIIIIMLLVIMIRMPNSENNEILIKNVVIENSENVKKIKFNQEINFDSLILKAINKGIPLAFKVTLRVVEISDIWPTKTILKKVGYYQIEYKTLRKVYRIEDINGNKHEYKYINEAIQKILKVEDFKFSFIDNNMNYNLWLNVALDRKKLPKPLQVNYFDRTWYMNSNKSIHQL